MRINEISKRYAKALILFTEQNSQTAEVLSELILIQAALSKDKDVSQFFSNPTVSFEKKQNTLASFFETVNNTTKTFILLLIEKNRFSNLEGIVQALQNYIDDKKGVTRGEIRYASALTEKELESVEQILSKKLNKKIILTSQKDPSLLGGLVAQVGGWTFDDSLKAHLSKLEEILK